MNVLGLLILLIIALVVYAGFVLLIAHVIGSRFSEEELQAAAIAFWAEVEAEREGKQ